MGFHYKIIKNGQLIPFNVAVEKKYILLTREGFEINEDLQISESSRLVDATEREIYANDILRDTNGNRYLVEHLSGTFFFVEVNSNKGCIPMALSSLKIGNKIDNMVVEL